MSEWISVGEKLPEFGKEVVGYWNLKSCGCLPNYQILIRYRDNTKERGWCWCDQDEWDGGDRNDCIGFPVTHWIYLEPPEDIE